MDVGAKPPARFVTINHTITIKKEKNSMRKRLPTLEEKAYSIARSGVSVWLHYKKVAGKYVCNNYVAGDNGTRRLFVSQRLNEILINRYRHNGARTVHDFLRWGIKVDRFTCYYPKTDTKVVVIRYPDGYENTYN